MNELHFLRPHYLYLLIPFLLLTLFLASLTRKKSSWDKICSEDLLPYVIVKKTKGSYTPYLFLFFTLLVLILAMAGPTWQQISQPLIKARSGLIIALDLSSTMNAEDIKPSRLQRALYKINDLLNKRREGQTGFIVFTEDPYLVTPLTHDVETIKTLLPSLQTSIMPSTGQSISKAILKAADLLSQAGINKGSLLIVTAELSNQERDEAIAIATQKGIKVSVLGLGGKEAVPIPKEGGGFVKNEKGALLMTKLSKQNLMQLANSTRGYYTSLTKDENDVESLAKAIFSHENPDESDEKEEMSEKWHDQGYLLVLLALPFTALLFRRGILVMLLFFLPYDLQAYSWDELWKNSDQRAECLYHQEKYEEAKELFQNRDWRASAHYQLGDYQKASELFQENSSAEGYYNYATSKAKLGEFEEALAAYDKTLEKEPTHADALYNKQLIEEFLKQEEQKKDNSQEKSDKKEDQDQKQKRDEGQRGEESKDSQQEPEKMNESEEKSEKEEKELQEQYRDNIKEALKKDEKEEKKEKREREEVQSEEEQQRERDERWLQRVKDDPGGLLRRKFLMQYRQQSKSRE